jgi:hypothetical protein
MRFMMLVIPEGYEKAGPDFVPPADGMAAMMKYNEQLQEAGVLLSLDGLHPPVRAPALPFPAASRKSAMVHSWKHEKPLAASG